MDDSHIERQWQAACAGGAGGEVNGSADPDTHTVTIADGNGVKEGMRENEDIPGNENANGDTDGDTDGVKNLLERCNEVAGKVNGFLKEEFGDEDEVLRGVQRQTRIARGVIEECLQKYRYV